jgi:hypothetical protein
MLSRTNPLRGLFGDKQLYSDMEGNIVDSTDVEEVDGKLINKTTGEEVRRTKEGIMELLGRDTLKSLEKFNPELYYPFAGTPGTIGGLEDLAGMDATKYPGTDLAQMIFDARTELDRQQNYVNQGLGQWPQFDYWNQIANTFPGMR